MPTTLACLTFGILLAGGPATRATDKASAAGKAEFLACGKVPADRRVVKLTLAPEVTLADLVRFMSTLSCRAFLIPSNISQKQLLRVQSPGRLLTAGEVYDVLIAALDSARLTIQPTRDMLRIVPQ
jgi:hypothetical protein